MSQIGADTYTRPDNASSWNPASDTQHWAPLKGGGAGYAIASNEGTRSGTTAESIMLLGSTTSGDMMLLVRTSRASSTATTTGVALRAVDSNHYYKVRLKSGNLEITSSINGTTTVLATTPYAVTPGSFDWVRGQIVGSTLYAKAWASGSTEPGGWTLTQADSSIGGVGQFGIAATLAPSDVASFDSFYADNLQSGPLSPYQVIGNDIFQRSNQTPFGAATDTQHWQTNGPATGSISNNTGKMTGATGDSYWWFGHGLTIGYNGTAQFLSDTTSNRVGLMWNFADYGDNYRCVFINGNLQLEVLAGGVLTVLASVPVSGYTTTDYWNIRAVRPLSGPITCRAWKAGTTEPSAWAISVSDTTLQGAGQHGIMVSLLGSANICHVDNLLITNNMPTPTTYSDGPYGTTELLKFGNLLDIGTIVNYYTLGMSTMRIQIDWTAMFQGLDGSGNPIYNWTVLDDAIAKLDGAYIKAYFCIQKPPSIYNTQACGLNGLLPTASAVIAFAQAIITRYNGVTINPSTGKPYGTLQCIENGNEDYDSYFNGPFADPVRWPNYGCRDSSYALVAQQGIWNAAKGLTPGVTPAPGLLVGSPALLGKRQTIAHMQQWTTDFCTGGGLAWCDFFNCHLYTCGTAPTLPDSSTNGGPSWDARITAIVAVLDQFGAANKPIWITEFGYTTPLPSETPPPACAVLQPLQSAYVIEALDLYRTLALPGLLPTVKKAFFWTIGSGKEEDDIAQDLNNIRVPTQLFNAWANHSTLYPQWPTPVVQVGVPIRGGTVDAIIRTGKVGGTVRAGKVDGQVRSGKADAPIRTGQFDATVRGEGTAP